MMCFPNLLCILMKYDMLSYTCLYPRILKYITILYEPNNTDEFDTIIYSVFAGILYNIKLSFKVCRGFFASGFNFIVRI
jgi:hypothetical protein